MWLIEGNLFQMINKTSDIMRYVWTNYAHNNYKIIAFTMQQTQGEIFNW